MDDRILMMADAIRDYFMEAVTINDYGKEMQYRGFRTPNCKEYKQYSQHSFGRAIDLDITGKNADEVRKIILDSPDKFSFITCIEIGVPWVHIDCRNCVAVLQVKPN
jgi:hypothetical protein